MSAWGEVIERLDRLEKKIDELRDLLRHRPTGAGGATGGPPAPKPRQRPDGSWERWGGEGTGWIPVWTDEPRNGGKPR